MTPARQCKRAEPTPTSEAWQDRWHREWRDRWEHRPGKDGWWPAPTAKPAPPKRDQVQFFLIIARRAP